ncbi:sigma-70 family RNA polymerase sigma factor [bacterium]|nr:sigma-70 family RNA polymerase sigma factor [bacterium]MCI0606426.1 sigma-70 family RNA polymerase sigma factor [bacterium]
MTGAFVWTRGLSLTEERASDELHSLFERLDSGDFKALEKIYDDYAPQIFGLALWRTRSRSDAADVVQEVFARLAGRAGKLKNVKRPYAYLLQIAHRISCDLFRKNKRITYDSENLIEPVSNESQAKLFAAQLNEFLLQLPSKQREVLYLHYFAGLSLREISEVVGVSLFTVASRCRLGLKKLKQRFGEEV